MKPKVYKYSAKDLEKMKVSFYNAGVRDAEEKAKKQIIQDETARRFHLTNEIIKSSATFQEGITRILMSLNKQII